MSKFLNEFKQFAMRGNVLDMAVGVIIGGAFGKIVSSVVTISSCHLSDGSSVVSTLPTSR